MKRLTQALLAVVAATGLCAQAVERNTYIYSVTSQNDTLSLDLYTDASVAAPAEGRPSVIFVFGGSFRTGSRSEAGYLDYFEFLAQQGYAVASIDYRTGMSDFNPASGIGGFVSSLQSSVEMAVADLFAATEYIVVNAETFNINPQEIIASGSSAGAITVLQAEYAITCGHPAAAALLPENFNYAGVISFAGAIMSGDGEPKFISEPCPILLFHGDADSVVPYNRATIGNAGLYGSEWIAREMAEKGYPREFYTISACGHEIATQPMEKNLYNVLAFLKETVGKKARNIIDVRQTATDAPKDYKTAFTLQDYIRSNM